MMANGIVWMTMTKKQNHRLSLPSEPAAVAAGPRAGDDGVQWNNRPRRYRSGY